MPALIVRLRAALVALIPSMTLVAGCTGLTPGFETPTVTITSFRALPGTGVVPQFEIGLQVTNPNRVALNLEGVSYSVTIEGRELVKGVSNELPVIEGYGTGDITLTAAPNLIAGARLVSDLLSGPRDTFSYALEAKLDVGAFIPAIRVRDAGEISLRPESR